MNQANITFCHQQQEGTELVIRLNRALLVENAQTLSSLRAATLAPLQEPACGAEAWIALRLDLRATLDLNSMGLSLLFEIVKSVNQRGGSCSIVLGSERVMRVVRFARLTSVARVSMLSPVVPGKSPGSKGAPSRISKPGIAGAARLMSQRNGGS